MASASNCPVLRLHPDRRCSINNTQSLSRLLDISEPFDKCHASAPYAKNKPYCSRPVNSRNRAEARNTIDSLRNVTIPSPRAHQLLSQLSSCAVCGISAWHQPKAGEVYGRWCQKLWDEYLRCKGMDPSFGVRIPVEMTVSSWASALQSYDTEYALYLEQMGFEESLEEEDLSDDGEDLASEDVDADDGFETPGTDISIMDSSILDDRTSTQSASPEGPLPQTDAVNGWLDGMGNQFSIIQEELQQQPRRAGFSVYRDQTSPSRPIETATVSGLRDSQPLAERDPNRQMSRATSRTPTTARPTFTHPVSSTPECPRPTLAIHQRSRGVSPDSSDSDGGGQLLVESESPIEADDESDNGDDESDNGDDESDNGDADESNDPSDDLNETEEEDESENIESQSFHNDEELEDNRDNEDVAPGSPRQEDANHNLDSINSTSEAFPASDLVATIHAITDDTESSPPLRSTFGSQPPITLRHYPQASTPFRQLKDLLQILQSPVSRRRRIPGFIYAFSRPSLPGYLKIGYVEVPLQIPLHSREAGYRVDLRLAYWRVHCGYEIAEVFRMQVACLGVARIESLVHTTLREYRRVEDPGCLVYQGDGNGQRRRKHNEWFEVGVERASDVVESWVEFAQMMPYDTLGKLKDFLEGWIRRDMEALRIWDTIEGWLTRFTGAIEELRQGELWNMVDSLAGS